MLLNIEHRIRFQYSDFISESWMELRMEPRPTERQDVHSFFLAVGPPTKVHRYVDWLGNAVHHFNIAEFHREIEIYARSIVETMPRQMSVLEVTEPLRPYDNGPLLDYLSFEGPITHSQQLAELAERVKKGSPNSLGEFMFSLAKLIHSEFEYHPDATEYHHSIDRALEQRAGVCQDFSQIMIGVGRVIGVPCRYVSGYLHVVREGHEVSESHAWMEFFSQEHGWVGFDPTNDREPDEHYVVVGYGRHYDDVPPNKGIFRGNADESLGVEVHTRLTERKTIASLREEIGEIDLPVYAEIPKRTVQSTLLDPVYDQQQQQQQ